MKITQKKHKDNLLRIHPRVISLLADEPITMSSLDPHWHSCINNNMLSTLLVNHPFHVIKGSDSQYLWLNPTSSHRLLLTHPAIHLHKLLIIEHTDAETSSLDDIIKTLLQAQSALDKRNSDGFAFRSDTLFHALKRHGIKPLKKKDIATIANCCPSNLRKGELS
ncbi:hypothetical protein [Enterovibrio norvegicus]|uniref:hypothetical protein n=1 Tax=Enterovibrio norvegicus TaxID=188144 RepID=UPI0024B1DC25|nr:hypothetical protein [Enterovibrio norvegicus]